jgi:hypothetical protein
MHNLADLASQFLITATTLARICSLKILVTDYFLRPSPFACCLPFGLDKQMFKGVEKWD